MKRRNGCTGKVRHATKDGACVALKKIGNAGLNVYRCRVCKGWHIGNSKFRIQDRIDQLLGIDRRQHAH